MASEVIIFATTSLTNIYKTIIIPCNKQVHVFNSSKKNEKQDNKSFSALKPRHKKTAHVLPRELKQIRVITLLKQIINEPKTKTVILKI